MKALRIFDNVRRFQTSDVQRDLNRIEVLTVICKNSEKEKHNLLMRQGELLEQFFSILSMLTRG